MRKGRERVENTLGAAAVVGAGLLALLLAGCVSDRHDARAHYRERVLADVPVAERRPDDGRSDEQTRRRVLDEIDRFAGVVDAASPAAAALTLSDSFRLTLARSDDLLVRGEQLLQAEALEREAIGNLLPEVLFNWRYRRDSDAVRFGRATISPRDTTESWLSVVQPIFDATLFAALDVSDIATRLEELALRTERDRLLYAVAATFFEVLALEEDLAALGAIDRLNREFLRVQEVLLGEGEILEESVIAARALAAESATALARCANDRAAARSRLGSLIGLDALPEELVDNYEMTYSPGLIPDLTERAWRTRSDVEASRTAIDLARAQRTAELSGYLPTVDAELSRWLKSEGAFAEAIDWTLAVNAAWPIIDGGARDAAYSRALSVVRQREMELSALKRRVRVEVEEAVLAFRTLDAAAASLETRREARRAALDQALARLEAEEITDVALLGAKSEYESVCRELERVRLARKQAGLKIRLVVGDLNLSDPMEKVMKEEGR